MSRTMELICDDWVGSRSSNRHVPDAGWNDVESAIRALDGKSKTQILVRRSEGRELVVGGGAGRYNAYVAISDEEIWTLVDNAKPEGQEQLVTGGQLGVFPARTVVGLEKALAAARSFFRDGDRARELDWTAQ